MLQNNEMSFDMGTDENDFDAYEEAVGMMKQLSEEYAEMNRMLRDNKKNFDQINFVNQTGRKYNK